MTLNQWFWNLEIAWLSSISLPQRWSSIPNADLQPSTNPQFSQRFTAIQASFFSWHPGTVYFENTKLTAGCQSIWSNRNFAGWKGHTSIHAAGLVRLSLDTPAMSTRCWTTSTISTCQTLGSSWVCFISFYWFFIDLWWWFTNIFTLETAGSHSNNLCLVVLLLHRDFTRSHWGEAIAIV